MTKARQLADLGNVYDDGALSNRNLIINSAMQVAQRGTSFTAGNTNSQYTLDRWKWTEGGSPTFSTTITQSTDAPDGFANSLKINVDTAQASLAAADQMRFQQRIEGQNLQQLAYGSSSAKDLTLSFWVKSNKTGTYIVWMYNTSQAKSASFAYTINASGTWEYKTIKISGDTSSAIPSNATDDLGVYFALAAGTDFTSGTLDGSWHTEVNADRYVGQVNLADTLNNYWQITGVQLEVGDTATPFEHRSYGDELARCQRFFERYEPDDSDGVVTVCHVYNTSNAQGALRFSPKRASPTVTVSGVVNLRNAGGSSGSASAISMDTSKDSCQLYYSRDASGLTAGHASVLRLKSGGYINIDAEL